jgi:hypothetical protein
MTSPASLIAIRGDRPRNTQAPNAGPIAISHQGTGAKLVSGRDWEIRLSGGGRGCRHWSARVSFNSPVMNLSRVLPGWSHLALHVCQDTRKHVAKLFRSFPALRLRHVAKRSTGDGHSAVKA